MQNYDSEFNNNNMTEKFMRFIHDHTWTHDVSPREDELDGPLVDHLRGEEEGVLVQQPQGRDPGLVVVPE